MVHDDTMDTQTEERQADTDFGSRMAQAALAGLAAASLAACGGGEDGAGTASPSETLVKPQGDPVAPTENLPKVLGTYVDLTGFDKGLVDSDAAAARFLLQAQFHASEEDIAAVRSLGIRDWLKLQYTKAYELGWDWMDSQGFNQATVNGQTPYLHNTAMARRALLRDLITTPASVRKRIALALSEFMVVGLPGLDVAWRSYLAVSYWDTLSQRALGSFRELLVSVSMHPAMGVYLNTKGNKKADGKGSQADENYAREVMQLFTIGLVELDDGGQPKLSGGLPIDTYTAKDVSSLAKVFTGYDYDQSQNVPTTTPGQDGLPKPMYSPHFARLPMTQTANNQHSYEAVTVFSGKPWEINIAANTSPVLALVQALDGLCKHPNVAPFFCKQMIQRLVTSNPSPAYVRDVVQVFRSSGGNLGQVFTKIFLHPEARGPIGKETGKLREPMLRVFQWARTFKAYSQSAKWYVNWGSFIQNPLDSPGVFNFFRPGYVPPSSELSPGKVAPEFQLVNESSVASYLNALRDLVEKGMPGANDQGGNVYDVLPSYTPELQLMETTSGPATLLNRLNLLLCANQLSAATLNTILKAISAMAATTVEEKKFRLCAMIFLVMASPEYLIQK